MIPTLICYDHRNPKVFIRGALAEKGPNAIFYFLFELKLLLDLSLQCPAYLSSEIIENDINSLLKPA